MSNATEEVFVPNDEPLVKNRDKSSEELISEDPDLLDRTEEKIEDAAETAARVIVKPFRFIGRHVSALAHATAAKIDRTNDVRRGRKEISKAQYQQLMMIGKAARMSDAEK